MKKIKTFRAFESAETEDIVTNVENMLLELTFKDITTKCGFIESESGFCIYLKKRASGSGYNLGPSFRWSDVSDCILPIMTYLEEEGFEYKTDEGTLSSGGLPVISTSGSHKFDTIFSKCEIIFRKKLIV